MRYGRWLVGLLSGLAIAGAAQADDADMARRVTAALISARGSEHSAYDEVRRLVLERRFEEFEARSRTYEARFAQDPLQESPLWKFYSTPGPDAAFQASLDMWVATRPSYISLTMRGLYNVNYGFHLRGDKYARETPDENIERMGQRHRFARADLTQALRQNPGFLPALGGLLMIEMARGNVPAADKLIAEATRIHPATYYVRHTYLRNLRPRWGGSYEAMAAYAESQVPAAKLNVRIWSLQGEAPAERGYSAMLERDYTTAVAEYTVALRYGDRLEFLGKRAYSNWSLGRYADALKDYRRYLEISPGNTWVVQSAECVRRQLAANKCVRKKEPAASQP